MAVLNWKKLTLSSAVVMAALVFSPVQKTNAADAPEPIDSKAVLSYLDEMMSWRRNVAALETVPSNSLETLQKQTLQKNSVKVLKYGFQFARAEAVVLDNDVTPDSGKPSQQAALKTALQKVEQLIPDLNTKIATLNTQIGRTPYRLRKPLLDQRERLNGELKFAMARDTMLKSVVTLFSDTESEEAVGLSGQLNNLERTLPELNANKKASPSASATPAPAVTLPLPVPTPAADTPADPQDQVSPSGILGLTSDIMSIYRKKKDLGELAAQTDAMNTVNQKLIDTIRASLKASIDSGNQLTNDTKTDVSHLDEQMDVIIENFKQLAAAAVPLGQAKYWLGASASNLQEWQNSLDNKLHRDFRTLTIRLIILGVALLVPLAISEALRRTAIRYIHDNRRLRQVNITRRVVFSIIVGIIVLLNIVTEFGSLATYIGLITAGLAVALQNVILSMVSYFFYFGRFGVRVGDRVTIGDVTGEVVQIGLIRLYLMELSGPDSELHPTGKIIAFPNLILFQPKAFSKQVPGTNYTWRKITFVLDATTDYKLANKKLMEAVQGIYEDYHEIMDHQQEALIRATHMNVKIPPPRGYIQFMEAGLALVIRYPIEISRAAEINERITKKIVETIASEPSLKLVSSNPPRIQPVTADDE